ncbi:MAG: type I glutamate--ammonia ligase [Candidatus Limnocylindrales bacterium]
MSERLTFVATCDLVAVTRGRSFPSAEYATRAAAGVGWVPADLALTTFGAIADPNRFGSLGDTRIVPVDAARVVLPAWADHPATDLVLGSIVESDGRPWSCCPRTALAEAVARLEALGIRLRVSFEQEFGLADLPGTAPPFSVEAHRLVEPFGSDLVGHLAEAGLEPETWLPEYGEGQYEITLRPTDPVTAADRAILLRALVRDLAMAHGWRATFAPLVRPDAVGNGVHIHLSLWDLDGHPRTLEPGLDPATGSPSEVSLRFAAGIVDHAPAVVAWTAPSVVSSLRFGPHRWSAAAAFVGRQNREAMIRLCPTLSIGGTDAARSANLEFRAADATANPWLALAAIIRAGIDGLERHLPPAVIVDGELEAIAAEDRERRGVRELPVDMESGLVALEADAVAASWFAADLTATHIAIRRTEAALLADLDPEARCRRYSDVL